MKNHSHLLNTFKLALVCGATLLPLSNANAGWNKLVEALEDVTPDAIAPLKVLRDQKLAESPNNMKWVKRSRQLAILETTPAKSLEGLKKHLFDRRLVDKTRNDKIEHKADGFVKAIQEVADSPEGRKQEGFVALARRAAEYKIGEQAVKQERTETPSSTLVKHRYINVQAQIASLEAFNAEMEQLGELDADIRRTISTNKAQLPQLQKLDELGVTEYRDGENLADLLSNLGPEVVNAEGRAEVDRFLARVNWDIEYSPSKREQAESARRELEYSKSLGIVSFVDREDLIAQITAKGGALPSDASNEVPAEEDRANSSPVHVPAAQEDDQLELLELALATAESERERNIYRAQLAKLRPQPVVAIATSNVPPQQPPAPKSAGFNIDDQIELCRTMISIGDEREKGMYKAKLTKLEAAKRAGIVTYDNEEELQRYLPPASPKIEALSSAPSVVSSVQADRISVPAQIESINSMLPSLGGDERENYNRFLQMHLAALEYGIENYANHADLVRQLREHGFIGEIVEIN